MGKPYKILLPALGKSSRFKNKGIFCDKMFLPISRDWTVLVIDSVLSPFLNEKFSVTLGVSTSLFSQARDYLSQRPYQNVNILELTEESQGQAHTVMMMLEQLALGDSDGFSVHNVDTGINYNLDNSYTKNSNQIDVFESDGDQWSFVEPADKMNVKRVTEKERISNLCSNGFYQFESVNLYKTAYEEIYKVEESKESNAECYIAPMYNVLIEEGHSVKYRLVPKNEHNFYGTPEEYFKEIEEINDK